MDAQIFDTVTLIDVDGTVSDTRRHMEGLNGRLVEAFPQIAPALPRIIERRSAFRAENGHLSFQEQDQVWRSRFPGTTSHNQLDIYRSLAPEVFDAGLVRDVQEWLRDPANFGSAIYPDVQPMLEDLRTQPSLPVLSSLGQATTAEGAPGWQTLKIDSAPELRNLPAHITQTLPEAGKAAVINSCWDKAARLFRFPLTRGGEAVVSRGLLLVDDSVHNLVGLNDQALGVLVDRDGRLPKVPGVRVVSSLGEVPDVVSQYARLLPRSADAHELPAQGREAAL